AFSCTVRAHVVWALAARSCPWRTPERCTTLRTRSVTSKKAGATPRVHTANLSLCDTARPAIVCVLTGMASSVGASTAGSTSRGARTVNASTAIQGPSFSRPSIAIMGHHYRGAQLSRSRVLEHHPRHIDRAAARSHVRMVAWAESKPHSSHVARADRVVSPTILH